MINKVSISREAKFDYEEIISKKLLSMPIKKYIYELEEYFSNIQPLENYFIKKYYDENLDKMLLLFFRKGMHFASLQNWIIVGICEKKDYCDDIEERGLIKNWLDNFLIA